jgi:aquaporin Z
MHTHNFTHSPYIAEFIGTFTLVFFGCGAIMIDSIFPGQINNIGIATTFGLVVMTVIYTLGSISGAHINPAVSIAFLFHKQLTKKDALFYVVYQIMGAIIASVMLLLILPEATTLGQTQPEIAIFSAFLIEFFATFFLMFVILNVATGHKETGIMAGLVIGGLILVEALIFGPLTGASMNPARSIGPAVVNLEISYLWLYIVAPLLGAISALPLYKLLRK